jgi:putative tryptophan/tyrosine transport system substrate-binding protein
MPVTIGRREFILLLSGAAMALPLPARAQRQERVRRIALLMNYAEGDTSALSDLLAFRQVLGELGWTEGHNIQFEYRWAAADADRMRSYARELGRLAPDVIVANTLPVAAAVKKETTTVPIVIAFGGDPVTSGLIANLAHPGGNITGFTVAETPLAGKWLELLKDLVPDATRVAIIRAPQNPNLMGYVRAIDAANARHKLELTQLDANDSSQIGRDIDAFAQGSKGALMVLPGPSTFVYREAIISAAARSRLPAIYPFRFFTDDGGLASYGANEVDVFRRAASYVDRILRGEKAGDLPVQEPTKFELVINLRTAKALGIEIPPTLLVIADKVID